MKTLLILLSVVAACQCFRPPYIGCQSSQECGKESCCVIGMGRYSIPKCELRRDIGESCRPNGEATNTVLHYPDGVVLGLEEVYHILCPCQSGLVCSEGGAISPQCEDIEHSNHIYQYSDETEY